MNGLTHIGIYHLGPLVSDKKIHCYRQAQISTTQLSMQIMLDKQD